MPAVSARSTPVGVVDGLLSDTTKTAKPALWSDTVRLETASVGVSLSVPPLPVPSSRIVPTPTPSAIVALIGAARLTRKVSVPSNRLSFRIGTVIVCVVTPGAKVSVPAPAV